MTDKYLTHAEAAKAKAEGKDVQALHRLWSDDGWIAARWSNFDDVDGTWKFRLAPPAPRVAQEFWIDKEMRAWKQYREDDIHVREVIPGEPTVREAVRDALERAERLCEEHDCTSRIALKIAALRRELCGDSE